MHLAQLTIHNLRNLLEVSVKPSAQFNLFYGDNGSGKTSLLEAIHYLGLGRSFRTRLPNRLIHHDAQHLAIFGLLHEDYPIPIGIQRHLNGDCQIRMAQTSIKSTLPITQVMPLQLLNPDSRQLFFGHSKVRRQFIDWGVFHVEPKFLRCWQQTQRILKQRNAALKSRSTKNMISLWDQELVSVAGLLHDLRKLYLDQLSIVFTSLTQQLFTDQIALSLKYKPGWDVDTDLLSLLAQSLPRDLLLGYTQYGPHRADVQIRLDQTIPAQDILSQGQQKLVVYALYLAQGILLKQQTNKRCIYLLDDLPAELDATSQQRVASVLQQMDAQVFITGVDAAALQNLMPTATSKMFHVKPEPPFIYEIPSSTVSQPALPSFYPVERY